MLHVIYEAAEDLEPGRLARVDEGRGLVRIRVDKFEPLTKVIPQLNIEIADFLSRADWYQLWGEEIASRHNPAAPIRLEYIFYPGSMPAPVWIREDKGEVHVWVEPGLTTEEFVAAVNPAVKDFLAGGCWFQLFGGEIIDHSPEPMQV
ncbi:hypothetical protein [Streptomyces griseofuscus]|uniref:Uncharacterized protein n=1 Tax=Streptomyces griseofuscus TaxID=146922 RepID=A0A426RYS6_9ACTN|nr:hypothetical protein [Streptomyces griseofuscus]RRQ81503.1 hypothetical protein CQW44_30345 [Streptomyces griseofuscus]